jgi:hypothetical protein
MKHLIILFFAFISSLSAYCQVNNLDEGNQCFNQGDYICAEAKYKEVFKTAIGKDKQIAEIKIQRTKRCIENLKNADLAFNSKNYTKAKENYNFILDSNPNDNYAKSQLEICNTKQKAKLSMDNLKIANQEFASLNYTKAKEKYQAVLDSNPKDEYAKSQIDKCDTKINESTITSLTLSKTELSFASSGGREKITINANTYTIEWLPSWCTAQKYDGYFEISCNANYEKTSKIDFFNVKAGNKTTRVNVIQLTAPLRNENTNQTTLYVPETQPQKPKLSSFSSLGFQSGEIAKFGILYERGGKRTVGFHISARTSNTSEEEILNSLGIANKTEADLGPNFELFNRFYLNVGVGFGYYDKILRNDYAGTLSLEKKGYLLATSGVMIRISRVININGGVSFMDVDKAFYKPEMSFGISFNLKNKNSY